MALAPEPQSNAAAVPVIALDRVAIAFDDNIVLRDVSFTLPRGQMAILLGRSGSGKSVILKLILGLLKPDSGTIYINGERIDHLREADLMRIRSDIGMLFQETALFDSLTVGENVGYRLYEETDMPVEQARQRVEEVLGFVGLSDYIDRMPSELSGGQRRRVAIARAIASRPRLLLFDDPTVGLDPITAKSIVNEIIKLRDTEQVTSIAVMHQLPDAFYIAKNQAMVENGIVHITAAPRRSLEKVQFMVLRDGRISFKGSADTLAGTTDPHLKMMLTGWIPPLDV